MNTLVFGGSGFLGSHVVDDLLKQNHEVTVFDINSTKTSHEKLSHVKGDIQDLDSVKNVIQGKDFKNIYIFSGISDLNLSFKNPRETLQTNINGIINILDNLKDKKINRVVFASTVYVYSDKGSFYGVSKKCCEKILEEYSKEFALPYTIVRYGSVYGPRSNESNRIYRILKEAISTGQVTFKGDGEEEREYIHVRDASSLSVKVLKKDFANKNIILTGIEKFKYSQLLEFVNEIMGGSLKLNITSEKYKGHYHSTPYSFQPTIAEKLVSNPYVDFGQGLLELIEEISKEKS